MVYHHRTVTCPNCGNVAERTRTVDSQTLDGSPFRVCPHCGKVYFDRAYNEPAISLFKDKGGGMNFWAFMWIIIANGFVIFNIVSAIKSGGFDESAALPFIVFLVIALVFDIGLVRMIKNRIKAKEYHQKIIDRLEGKRGELSESLESSMERMSNKAYLDALRAHGVQVPEYFYERIKDSEKSDFAISGDVVEVSNSMISTTDKYSVDEKPTNIEEKTHDGITLKQAQEEKEINATDTAEEEQIEGERSTLGETVFCRKCGGKMPADSVFCPKCGEKVFSFHI